MKILELAGQYLYSVALNARLGIIYLYEAANDFLGRRNG
jgi:hypothetical protein